MTSRLGRSITYPTHHLLAVLDEAEAAERAAAALLAAGVDREGVHVLTGEDGAGAIDGLGERHGPWARIVRLVQFTTMDQMPDFRTYEAALLDGRSVVAVRARTRAEMLRARDVLVANGAHFLNYFGRFSTEEVGRWRGPELDLPTYLRR